MAQFVKRPTGKVMARIHGVGAKTFLNMKDAKTWAYEMERRKTLGDLYIEASPTFLEYRKRYVRQHAAGWADSSKERHRHTLTALKPLDDLTLESITRSRVEHLITDIARTSPSTAGMALSFLKRLLRDAEAQRLRVDTGIYGLHRPRYEKRPIQFLTWDEVERLASWMPEFIHRIVLVAALTGMRQGELFHLKDTDLDLDNGFLWVQRGKTVNSRRKVHLGSDAVFLLREQLIRRPQGSELVFPASRGGVIDKNAFMHHYFRPARDSAGLNKDVTFHSLRHTFVSIAASRGVKSDFIAEMAGWSQQSWHTMFSHYRHFFAEEAPAEAKKMSGLLTGTGTTP